MSRVLRASYRTPLPGGDLDDWLIDDIIERTRREFADELMRKLDEAPGGLLVGRPQVSKLVRLDFIDQHTNILDVEVWANVEDLPEPPEYRLVGGPADNVIVRTNGQRYWRVVVAPPPYSVQSITEPQVLPRLIAEYERQGTTSTYFFTRMVEG